MSVLRADSSHSAIRGWLRLEGVAVLALSVALYAHVGEGWLLFALLLFAFDASMVGYLRDARTGALVYNLVHTYTAPLVLGTVGLLAGIGGTVAVALIWSAHIGMDRALGYGLKLPTSFQHTHLGAVGRGQAITATPNRRANSLGIDEA